MTRRVRYDTYHDSVRWRVRREEYASTRDRCEICGARKATNKMHVHHVTYSRMGNERDTDLLLLCIPCHDGVHRIQRAREETVFNATAIYRSLFNKAEAKRARRTARA